MIFLQSSRTCSCSHIKHYRRVVCSLHRSSHFIGLEFDSRQTYFESCQAVKNWNSNSKTVLISLAEWGAIVYCPRDSTLNSNCPLSMAYSSKNCLGNKLKKLVPLTRWTCQGQFTIEMNQRIIDKLIFSSMRFQPRSYSMKTASQTTIPPLPASRYGIHKSLSQMFPVPAGVPFSNIYLP